MAAAVVLSKHVRSHSAAGDHGLEKFRSHRSGAAGLLGVFELPAESTARLIPACSCGIPNPGNDLPLVHHYVELSLRAFAAPGAQLRPFLPVWLFPARQRKPLLPL